MTSCCCGPGSGTATRTAILDLYNCCFSTELLRNELAWTREDPLLGYLLWTGPYADERRGILTAHLEPEQLAECADHLDALSRLRSRRSASTAATSSAGSPCSSAASAGRCSEWRPRGRAPPIRGGGRDAHDGGPAGAPWTLTELAAELHLAPGYLVRLFKSATGLPPMAYLSRLRVELAAAQLLQTDQSICRIGESVGWPDQNYFARRFRAHFGLSASTYRSRFADSARKLQAWSNSGRPR